MMMKADDAIKAVEEHGTKFKSGVCEKPEVKSKLVANKAPGVEPKYHRPLFNMNFCNDTNGFCHD